MHVQVDRGKSPMVPGFVGEAFSAKYGNVDIADYWSCQSGSSIFIQLNC
jgi:hypothetical protein